MNTATISPALEVATPKPAQGQANKQSDTGDSPPFSEVLSHQHASQSAKSDKPSSDASAPKQKESSDAASHEARDEQGPELLKHASEAGNGSATIAHIVTDKAASLRGLDGTAQQRRLTLDTEISATQPKFRHTAEGSATNTLNALRFVASPTADTVKTDQPALAALIGKPAAEHTKPEKAPLETVNLHQSATADGKARQQASGKIAAMMAAAGGTDGRPSVPGNSKVTVSEFSTAMVDAAAHAQSRFTSNATPDPVAPPLAVTSEHALAQGALASSGSTIIQNGNLAAIPGTATPLSSPQWASDFGRQFVNIAQNSSNGIQIAELRLDPPELGPLRITINLSDNVAHASFVSPHAMVRQTVENALPQLQQLLAQAGISLGDTSVDDQSQAGQSSDGDTHKQTGSNRTGGSNGLLAEGATEASGTARRLSPDALVDTFA